jgi:hypothetical protein
MERNGSDREKRAVVKGQTGKKKEKRRKKHKRSQRGRERKRGSKSSLSFFF